MNNLIGRLREGTPQVGKRWSGDCGEMSTVDEVASDALMIEAAEAIEGLTDETILSLQTLARHSDRTITAKVIRAPKDYPLQVGDVALFSFTKAV